ncbi:ubiquitin-binding protein cue5 [Conoideocrella luteorostrata]|uniref:Ubiquitin-binding protein cue5 n=1 Tax=Conoideocrella luteorostrata TaxID=1105319 RepID=A0AAJ0CNH4_9HYPO|nr:ubiquitin-binding protein cue5 [Conoideocrella luteorostrata]
MSTPAESNKHGAESGAESPTTARPLEMDDDDVQDTSIIADDGPGAKSNTTSNAAGNTTVTTPPTTTAPSAEAMTAIDPSAEVAPQKPPRPVTEAQKNVMILKEAFPSVDDAVIRAVLRASGGKAEPAFNALLEMTDPDAVKDEPEEVPPPQPPRPQGRGQMTQVEADELYARQLAEHYDNVSAYEARTSNRSRNTQQMDEDREHNFMDDDLPVIRDNLRKGFLDTQSKVNGWITNLRKRLEDSFDESEENTQHHGQPTRRQGETSRRSGDYERYDADPQVLSDDFAGIKLSSDGSAAHGRPTINSGIHRPPPPSTSPRPGNGRRVGFKDEPEEINMYDTSPTVPPKDTLSNSGKASKWKPLSSVEPSPITDNDPFSLGDSEDEKEVSKDKPKDTKTDDTERLKKAAAEAMAENLVEPPKHGASADKKS